MLHTVIHGANDKPSLLVAHGLFGSGRNWGVISKRLSDIRQVLAIDHRNHGLSPWTRRHRYSDMTKDLAGVISAHTAPMDVLCHSMGGNQR